MAAGLVELIRHGFLHRGMGRSATLPFGHQDRQSGLRSLHVPLASRNDGQYPGLHAPTRVDGARQDLDTTLRHLVDHNCRILLQSHFDEGASRRWILQMIELGQKSHETS